MQLKLENKISLILNCNDYSSFDKAKPNPRIF